MSTLLIVAIVVQGKDGDMTPEYIDKNKLIKRFNLRLDWLEKDKHDDYTTGIWDGCLYDVDIIKEAPSEDVAPVIHSMWNFNKDGSATCEHCGRTTKNAWDYDTCLRYCPDCGSKMDGGNENGKAD